MKARRAASDEAYCVARVAEGSLSGESAPSHYSVRIPHATALSAPTSHRKGEIETHLSQRKVAPPIRAPRPVLDELARLLHLVRRDPSGKPPRVLPVRAPVRPEREEVRVVRVRERVVRCAGGGCAGWGGRRVGGGGGGAV